MRRSTFASLFALVALPVLPALAHEFWLLPSKFRPAVREIVSIKTLVGDGYVGESRPRDPTKLDKFVLATPDGEVKVMGKDGLDPAGFVRIGTAGTYVMGYRSKNTRVVLSGEKFEKYLVEKGLDEAAASRKSSGKTAEDGRERFSRCAKSIISVGDKTGSGWDHEFKFPLEIVPSADPYTLHAGDSLSIKVLADGKPAENMLIEAWVSGKAGTAATARTGKDGTATFKLEQKGEWLFNTVKMTPVTEAGADVEWESLWASLTFDLADKPAETKAEKPAEPVPAAK